MKPVSEWDEEYVLSLPVGESDWLEAKARVSLDLTAPGNTKTKDDLLNTLSKELAAFANSGGGTLVFGLVDPSPGATEWQVSDGGVDVSVKGGTRAWLEQLIPDSMEPPLQKFNVYEVLPSATDPKIAPGRALYVVEVQDSEAAPHQSRDHKYYFRAGK